MQKTKYKIQKVMMTVTQFLPLIHFITFNDDGWTDWNFLYLTLYGITIKTILHIALNI